MESIHEETYKGYTIKIMPDSLSDDPRNWDNAGKMVCWHSRYTLGDKQPKENPVEFLCSLLGLDSDKFFDNRETMELLLEKASKDYIVLPLYTYEHGAITISTSHEYPYNDRWDAGQVGWIYISKKDAVKEWGKSRFTKDVEARAVKYLQGEVKTYDDYLRGDVYGFQVCDEDDEVLDSCWGFYPEDGECPDYGYCLKEAKNSADSLAEVRQEEEDSLFQRVAIAVSKGD
jgi:hypothetical protein